MNKFAIVRILGNELPPRDPPGSRLAVLDFMLERGDPPEVVVLWIVSSVHDKALAAAYRDRLERAGAQHFIIEPDYVRYAQASDAVSKLLAAIPLNEARNTAIAIGRSVAEFTVVLDGDCWFLPEQWLTLEDFIQRDQQRSSRRYYTVLSQRTTLARVQAREQPLERVGEGMIVFRRDATLSFDPLRQFGNGPKQELLTRLGHRVGHIEQTTLRDVALTAIAGTVLHLAVAPETEVDLELRMRLRRESIQRLLTTLDAKVSLVGNALP